MPDKKVLIITYYWPPSGGSGVQRWLKFVKYLPGLGWTPYVFTPANPSFALRDESLQRNVPPQAQVIRFPIWEPYEAFFKLAALGGKKQVAVPTELVSGEKKSLFQKISTWIRGNLIIPDPRVFWVRPSVKFLQRYLNENNITTIVTTGPPHSLHLIGYKLKKKNPSLRWLADFRDPWSEWGLLDSLMVGTLARRAHRRLERRVLQTADEVITITPFYVRHFQALGQRPVRLLTNGYDPDDFSGLIPTRPERFLILHAGIVNEKCDPRPFMRAVESLAQANDAFRQAVAIEFIGAVHGQFKTFVESSATLQRVTTFTPPMPHGELVLRYGSAAVLLLVLTGYKDAEGYMPGKLFEYLATGLPIIATGPEQGDAANLLNETQAGHMIDGSRHDAMVQQLASSFHAWRAGTGSAKKHAGNAYSRREITRALTDLL